MVPAFGLPAFGLPAWRGVATSVLAADFNSRVSQADTVIRAVVKSMTPAAA